MRASLAFALLATAALLGPIGAASAGGGTPAVLQGDFSFDDNRQGPDNCSTIEFDGNDFSIDGTVTGIGLSDDTVTIGYFTPIVDKVSVKSAGGSVGEKAAARIDVDIAPGAGSATAMYAGSANPDRGRVTGKVAKGGASSKVSAQFELGSDLAVLNPPPDPDQLATLVEAFRGRSDVRVRAGNGVVKIGHKGVGSAGCP